MMSINIQPAVGKVQSLGLQIKKVLRKKVKLKLGDLFGLLSIKPVFMPREVGKLVIAVSLNLQMADSLLTQQLE